ncbi:MAG: hypothetical protein HC930_14810 [Hydrococcus sp. SU_1_0]|nr:hypothetical protein [Hydrococcus sp. SU_1_0]
MIGLRNSGEADGVFLRVTDCLNDEHFLEIAHRVYLQPENRSLRWSQDLLTLQNGVTRENRLSRPQAISAITNRPPTSPRRFLSSR